MTATVMEEVPTIAKVLRILLVEDEMMISMLLEDLLKIYGYDVVGPASRVSNALELASLELIDGAILDLNVAEEVVYPVAEALAARKIPFLFVTGYNASAISQKFRNSLTLQKPFKPQVLKRTLKAMLA